MDPRVSVSIEQLSFPSAVAADLSSDSSCDGAAAY
jgi:hypothetical protein